MRNLIKGFAVEANQVYEVKLDVQETPKSNTPVSSGALQAIKIQGSEEITYIGRKLTDAKEEAERVMLEARQYATQIVSEAQASAKAQIEQAIRDGYEQGYEVGQREGRSAGRREIEEQVGKNLDDLTDMMNNIRSLQEEIITNQADDMRTLAIEIAKRVVNAELEVNSDVLANIFAGAIKSYIGEKWIKLTISSQDRAFVTSQINKLKEYAKGSSIEIISLDEAPKGTCIIEFPKGAIDISPQQQFDKIEKTLKN